MIILSSYRLIIIIITILSILTPVQMSGKRRQDERQLQKNCQTGHIQGVLDIMIMIMILMIMIVIIMIIMSTYRAY